MHSDGKSYVCWPIHRSYYYGAIAHFLHIIIITAVNHVESTAKTAVAAALRVRKQQVAPCYTIIILLYSVNDFRFLLQINYGPYDDNVLRRGSRCPTGVPIRRATPISFMMSHNIFGRRRSGSRGPPQPVRKPPSRYTNYSARAVRR